MKLEQYPFQAAHKIFPGQRVEGKITLPQSANIVHVGAAPPSGEMFAYAEVSEIEEPKREVEVCVIKVGDPIPKGWEYLGYILAVPILFIYERKSKIVLT